MKAMLLLIPALLLAGCAVGAPGSATIWNCDDGKTFTARFPAEGQAEVWAGGLTYQLTQEPTASGVRYSSLYRGVRSEYTEHQGRVTLTGVADEPYENCRTF
jgi:hypothetical protein